MEDPRSEQTFRQFRLLYAHRSSTITCVEQQHNLLPSLRNDTHNLVHFYLATLKVVCMSQLSSCVGVVVWMALEYYDTGYLSLTGMVSGALAGLAGVTPGSGFVHRKSACLIGAITTACSFYASSWLKSKLRLDGEPFTHSPTHCLLLSMRPPLFHIDRPRHPQWHSLTYV